MRTEFQHTFSGHIPSVQTVISQEIDKSVNDSLFLLKIKVRYPIPKIVETGFSVINVPWTMLLGQLLATISNVLLSLSWTVHFVTSYSIPAGRWRGSI